MNQQFLLLLILSSIFVSCAGSTGGDSAVGWQDPILSKNPIRLIKEDAYCGMTFSAIATPTYNLRQFINGASIFKVLAFDDQLLSNYVQSRTGNIISTTEFGFELSLLVDLEFLPSKGEYVNKNDEATKGTITSQPKKLFVCPEAETYGHTSFEAAGLSINYSISKTHNKVSAALPSHNLKPVSVEVAPLKKYQLRYSGGELDRKQEVLFSTDNAYYSPTEESIVFLPQSQEYFEDTGSAPFWEMPMVGSHEYGHHIFRTLTEGLLKIDSDHHMRGCFTGHMAFKNLGESDVTDTEIPLPKEFSYSAINEGFADLIAYYTLEEQEGSLYGVPCFQANREVGSGHFRNGVAKVFSNRNLLLVDFEVSQTRRRSCNQEDYQEIHHVGAVFAHHFDKLISKVNLSKTKKLKVLLNWAKSLVTIKKELLDMKTSEYLFRVMELGYKIALDEANSTYADKCMDMKTAFPDYHMSDCKYLN